MKILIRVDSNKYIATGHVMRCISIAQMAIKEGNEVKFIVADLQSEILLKKYDMPYICLYTTWNEMDGEIEKISRIIENEKPDCVLVDSYYVTEKYLSALRMFCKVAYIDDLNMFIYPCDILICYANYFKKFNYEDRYSSETKLLLGPKFAPLRQAFVEPKRIKKEDGNKKILVMSGGTDEYHVISNFLAEYVKNAHKFRNVSVDAICGVYNKDYDEIERKYSNHPNINILKSVDNIEKYMLQTDVAISAGGATLYELCACGTPTICYAIADNQLDNVESFSAEGVMIYAGDIRQDAVINKVIELLIGGKELMILSEKMQKLVDGNGAYRIVTEIKDCCKYKN